MSKPLKYKDLLSEEQVLDKVIYQGFEYNMSQVYKDHDSYRSFIEDIYESKLYINSIEITTVSIDIYNEILIEEINKGPENWDTEKLSVYIYKLSFLLLRYNKKVSNMENRICSKNIVMILLNNFDKGIYPSNPFTYINSIIRFRFYDLLNPNFLFNKSKDHRLNIEYTDNTSEVDRTIEFENLLISKIQSNELRGVIEDVFNKYIKYTKVTKEYVRLRRDVFINILNHYLSSSDPNVIIIDSIFSLKSDKKYLNFLVRIVERDVTSRMMDLYSIDAKVEDSFKIGI